MHIFYIFLNTLLPIKGPKCKKKIKMKISRFFPIFLLLFNHLSVDTNELWEDDQIKTKQNKLLGVIYIMFGGMFVCVTPTNFVRLIKKNLKKLA